MTTYSISVNLNRLYLDNLSEWILDDRKFICYKSLSCKLGVHVNTAKQMLYQFTQVQKERGNKIHTLYYLSGTAPQRWISSLGEKKADKQKNAGSDGEGSASTPPQGSPDLFDSPDEEEEGYYNEEAGLVMLCKDDDLERLREHFTEVFSIHVYGCSVFPMTDEKLTEHMNMPKVDDEGRPPLHYGAIYCKAGTQMRTADPRMVAFHQNIKDVKAKVEEDRVRFAKMDALKKQEQKEKEKEEPLKKREEKSSKPASKETGGGGGGSNKNRIKNMFAAAAAKPKPPPPKAKAPSPIVEVSKSRRAKEESSDEEFVRAKKAPEKKESKKPGQNKRESTTNNRGKQNGKQRESEGTRKRKRIRDILSSSEDEEETRNGKRESDSEEETLPESPFPTKGRKLFDSGSESDDDFKPTVNVNKSEKDHEEKKPSGRKKVKKTISRHYKDEDNYLVTENVEVMVSESDHSEGDVEIDDEDPFPKKVNDKKESKSVTSKATSEKKEKVTDKESATKGKEPTKKSSAAAKPSSNAATTGLKKQASITSFFKKQ